MKYWAFILFLIAFMVLGVMAQDPTPDPLMTETPSITPPYYETIIPTEITPIDSTNTPTATVFSVTETATASPTMTAESETPMGTPSETGTATGTPEFGTPSLTPSSTSIITSVPPSSGNRVVYSDNFDNPNLGSWSPAIFNLLDVNDPTRLHWTALQVEPLSFSRGNLQEIVIQANVFVQSGFARFAIRESESGQYELWVGQSGQVILYRNEVVVAQTTIPAITSWLTVEFRAVADMVAVSINSAPVLSFSDTQPLPSGIFSIKSDMYSNSDFLLDNVIISAIQVEPPLFIAPAQAFSFAMPESSFSMASMPINQIVFQSSAYDEKSDIWLINEDGTNPIRLTNNIVYDSNPAWSPDGSKIAFSSSRTGNAEIYVMNPDGTNVQQLTQSADGEGEPTWSPDGTRIAFTAYSEQGQTNIYVMSSNGGAIQLLKANASFPAWGKNNLLTYTSYAVGQSWLTQQVFLMDVNGNTIRQLSAGESGQMQSAWSPDGSLIAYSVHNMFTLGGALKIVDINGMFQRQVGPDSSYPSWSPDGSRIVFDYHDSYGEHPLYTVSSTAEYYNYSTTYFNVTGSLPYNVNYYNSKGSWKPQIISPTPSPTATPRFATSTIYCSMPVQNSMVSGDMLMQTPIVVPIYAEPSSSSAILGMTTVNTSFDALAKNYDSDWYLGRALRDDNNVRIEGWLQGANLDWMSCDNFGSMPIYVNQTIVDLDYFLASGVCVRAGIVNTTDGQNGLMRQQPDSGSTAVVGIGGGEPVIVIGLNYDVGNEIWYLILYGANQGWISGGLILLGDEIQITSETATPMATTIPCNLSVVVGPTPFYTATPSPMPSATPAPNGDICTAYVLRGDAVNVRANPYEANNVLYEFGPSRALYTVKILEKYIYADNNEVWFKVTSIQGEGYVSASVVRAKTFDGNPCNTLTVFFLNREYQIVTPAPAPTYSTTYITQAQGLYAYQGELRLPEPFDLLPLKDSVDSTQGYGMNEFAFLNQGFYDGTNHIHSGLDLFGTSSYIRNDPKLIDNYGTTVDPCTNSLTPCSRIQAICNGRVVGYGSTLQTNDIGLAIRCDMRDGTPSNIVVVYNHLERNPSLSTQDFYQQGLTLPYQVDTNNDGISDGWEQAEFPKVGTRYKVGQDMFIRLDPQNESPAFPPHLHLEVFYVVNGGDYLKNEAIRINPILFFSAEIQAQITSNMKNYYPKDRTDPVTSDEYRYSWLNYDTTDAPDNAGVLEGSVDTDLGIEPEYNDLFSIVGDFNRNGEMPDIWERTDTGGIQDISNSSTEYNPEIILTVTDLINAMRYWQMINYP